MVVVYRAVPAGMVGTILYPLSELARVSADAYELQRLKYTEREAVREARVTASGLRFNETIHCSPLHPRHLYRLRAQMELLPTPRPSTQQHWSPGLFFEIPVERIRQHELFWYRWKTPWINGYAGEPVAITPPLDEFERLDAARYRELTAVPEAHAQYLHRQKAAGRRPLMFVHVPHVLVAGPIETKGLRRISWEDEPSAAPA